MEDRKYKIYVLKEPDGITIRYVGYTGKSLNERLYNHIFKSKTGVYYHNALWILKLLKNGEEPLIELIENNLSQEEAKNKEIFYIGYFRDLGCDLTNNTPGGDGNSNPSLETRNKISKTRKDGIKSGRIPTWLGLKHKEITKTKISSIKKKQFKNGLENGFFGKHHSIKTRKKISGNHFGVGCKKVQQIDLDSKQIIKTFSSVKEAFKTTNIQGSNISAVCNGRLKTAGGYQWKFINHG